MRTWMYSHYQFGHVSQSAGSPSGVSRLIPCQASIHFPATSGSSVLGVENDIAQLGRRLRTVPEQF